MTKPTVYLSIDIEADGPIPGNYSMLSLGGALFTDSGELVSTFSANLKQLNGAWQDPDTMQFWADNHEAYAEATKDPQDIYDSMEKFSMWIDEHVPMDTSVTLIGYPIAYDFMWVYWYYWEYLGKMPRFSFSGLDIKTYAAATLKSDYKHTTKRNWPKAWRQSETVHAHVAETDAIEQGEMFFLMRDHNTARHTIKVEKNESVYTLSIDGRDVVSGFSTGAPDMPVNEFVNILARMGYVGNKVSSQGNILLNDVLILLKKLGNRVLKI